MAELDRKFGREAFGEDPDNYDNARPPYPEATWQALRERAGLGAGIDILEVGAGTGLATRQLLSHGPRRLLAVEPDPRLAAYLTNRISDDRFEVLVEPFEAARLPEASFDLVACATAFHWLDRVTALQRVREVVRPGGHVALWWNVYGDPNRADAFHDATTHLFGPKVVTQAEFALDTEARLADLSVVGFAADPPELLPWTLRLDAEGVRRLYASYSNVTALPPGERMRLLDDLVEVAEREFGGAVERNLTTAIYTARSPA